MVLNLAASAAARGVITYLVAGDDIIRHRLYGHLQHSLPYLETNVLQHHPYPIVLFYSAGKPSNAAHLESLTSTDFQWVNIDAAWNPPRWLTNELAAGGGNTAHDYCKCGKLHWPIDYCLMNEFFIRNMYHHDALRSYDYYWRIDVDTYVVTPLPEDPFVIASSEELDFLYLTWGDTDMDYQPCLVGMCDAVRRYSPNADLTTCGERWAGQFMLGNLAYFRSVEYAQFADFMMDAAQGGVYRHRWADQNIVPMSFRVTGRLSKTRGLMWNGHFHHTRTTPPQKDRWPSHLSAVACDDNMGWCEFTNVCSTDRDTLVFQSPIIGHNALERRFKYRAGPSFRLIPNFDTSAAVWHDELVIYRTLCCCEHITHYLLDDVFPALRLYLQLAERDPAAAANASLAWGGRACGDFQGSQFMSFLDKSYSIDSKRAPPHCYKRMRMSTAKFELQALLMVNYREELRDNLPKYAALVTKTHPTVAFAPVKRRVVIADRRPRRRMINVDELATALRKDPSIEDVEVVLFQQLGAREGFQRMQRADTYIYVHGAGMKNVLFLPPNATVVTVYIPGTMTHWRDLNTNVGMVSSVKTHVHIDALSSVPSEHLHWSTECEALKAQIPLFNQMINRTDWMWLPKRWRMCSVNYWINRDYEADVRGITNALRDND